MQLLARMLGCAGEVMQGKDSNQGSPARPKATLLLDAGIAKPVQAVNPDQYVMPLHRG
jgi:hypothetical protein